MDYTELTQFVTNTAQTLGFDLVGIAPAGPSPDYERFQQWLAAGHGGEMAYLARRAAERADARALLPEARSVIVLGANYHSCDLPTDLHADPSRGRIAAYAWGDDYHDQLKPLLFQLDSAIRSVTGRASPGKAYVDSGPVLERSWAAAAGLGFIGKNTCLIAPRSGSWLFLAVLVAPEVLDYEIRNSEFRIRNSELGCGRCRRCLDVCPTAAFVAPHVLDARRCISYLTIELAGPIPLEMRPLIGNWVFGCDLCQLVCPWNRRFARPGRLAASWAAPQGADQSRCWPGNAAPKLLDLLALDEQGFRHRFRGSPVKRAKRRGLLRNVCVALGNWGDPAALPGLSEALNDGEPLVRGHAAWALGQIGGGQPAGRAAAANSAAGNWREQARSSSWRALEQRLASEPEPYVRAEIMQALARVRGMP